MISALLFVDSVPILLKFQGVVVSGVWGNFIEVVSWTEKTELGSASVLSGLLKNCFHFVAVVVHKKSFFLSNRAVACHWLFGKAHRAPYIGCFERYSASSRWNDLPTFQACRQPSEKLPGGNCGISPCVLGTHRGPDSKTPQYV